MKKIISILLLLSMLCSLGLTSCKKTHVPPPDEDSLSIPQELIDEWTVQYNLTEDDYIIKVYKGNFHQEFLSKNTIGEIIQNVTSKYEPEYEIVYAHDEVPEDKTHYTGTHPRNFLINYLKNGKEALKRIGVDAEIQKVYYLVTSSGYLVRLYIYYVTDKGDFVLHRIASSDAKTGMSAYLMPVELYWKVAKAMEKEHDKLIASGEHWMGGDGRNITKEIIEKFELSKYRIGSLIE